jgi:hypothetical protein
MLRMAEPGNRVMQGKSRVLALCGLVALGGCAIPPPSGPRVVALPEKGKDLAQFQREDLGCRQGASAAIGGANPQQEAANAAVGTAVVGTVIGAAAGALIGAAAGNPGAGAAIGAGAGLLTGSAAGANAAVGYGQGAQYQYDVAYAQCMAAAGNQVQAPQAPSYAGGYGYPGYGYGYGYPYYAPFWGPAFVVGGYWGRGWGWGHRGWGGGWGRRR